MNPDPHATGGIIAGAFWDLRKLIGHDTAEHLFQLMEYLHPDGIDVISPQAMDDAFISVLLAVATADDNDNDLRNGTPHINQILTAFSKHGINLSSLFTIVPAQVENQDTIAASYPVTASVGYLGEIGSLDTNSVQLTYSTDHWSSSHSISMQRMTLDSFSCAIPKLSGGGIVEYYVTASTTIAQVGKGYGPTGAPKQPLIFLVGYSRVSLDDAEKDRGWSLSAPTDQAITGLWTRDVPFGTFNTPGDFVQQDTDHSPNGTMCYLTGNANAATQSNDVSLDDVDGGSTTLTTPLYDLSTLPEPAIRFWYYYSNDAGDNPAINTWKVQLSSNGGLTWKYILETRASTLGWTQYLVRVSDYVLPSTKVQLRFIASDTVGAIVEAGVDDLEILEGPKSEASFITQSQNVLSFDLGAVYPNPATSVATVELSLPQPGHVVAFVKDVLGRVVQTPLDRYLPAGRTTVPLSTSDLPSGIYWVQAMNEGKEIVRRFAVAK